MHSAQQHIITLHLVVLNQVLAMLTKVRYRVEYLISLYENYGSEMYFGEHVTQLQHALQAAQLAEQNGADTETVIAAFLHDIGHLCDKESDFAGDNAELGNTEHDLVGAAFLKSMGFSQKVCSLVCSHVKAKRYLTYRYPDYYDTLSDASKKTLEQQGGKMTEKDALDFSAEAFFEDALRLRIWDDEAKSTDLVDEDLSRIKRMLTEHLSVAKI